MKKAPFALLALTVAALLLGAGDALAWHKDPDSAVDPAHVVASTILPAPDVTIGDDDLTAAGTADAVVGAGDITATLADPPSSGTLWVDNTPADGDCPQAT